MGFFKPSGIGGGGGGGGGHKVPHHNFVVIALVIMKFVTGIKLDAFYSMGATSLWRDHYYVIVTS